jgi:phytoene desaturase
MSNGTGGTQSYRVAVVGAGLGGLAAAMRLAAAGYEVDVYEASDAPGGKAGSERIGDYRFDTGPSLFTMHWVFEELFRATGASLESYLSLSPLETICNYFWTDEKRLQAYRDPDRFAAELERVFGEPPEHLREYLAYSQRMYEIAGALFLEYPIHEVRTLLSKRFLRSMLKLGQIDSGRSMDQANGSFFTHPRIRQLFNRYATYNGSSPYRAPATLNIIPYVEYIGGAYAVAGGIRQVPKAMEKRAAELGVRFSYRTPVERILYARRRPGRWQVTGVQVAGEALEYPTVVSNVDVSTTYESLLADAEAPPLKRYRKLEPSSSGLVFYWGVTRQFEELGLHNIFFSDDYRREFRQIFDELALPGEPTIYVNITSRTGSPGDAPAGHDNWFVLLNAPYEAGQQWDWVVPQAREHVLRRIGEVLGVSLEEYLAAEGTMTPKEIAERTGSYRGSLYGISSNSIGAAFARHRNRSLRYRGLYLCGGSVHPGGGMPLSVLSGKLASELVQRHS